MALYYKCYRVYNLDDPRAVCWTTKEAQNENFKEAAKIFEDKKPSLLDVGCGLGAFYDWLIANNYKPNYHGIDLLANFVEECKKRNLNVEAKTALKVEKEYDYILALGTFHYTTYEFEDPTDQITKIYKHLFSKARKAFVFTLLHKNKESLHTYTREQLDLILQGTDAENVEVNKIQGGDQFIIYLSKE
mgnify:CR=1 FL=1